MQSSPRGNKELLEPWAMLLAQIIFPSALAKSKAKTVCLLVEKKSLRTAVEQRTVLHKLP